MTLRKKNEIFEINDGRKSQEDTTLHAEVSSPFSLILFTLVGTSWVVTSSAPIITSRFCHLKSSTSSGTHSIIFLNLPPRWRKTRREQSCHDVATSDIQTMT